MTTTPTTGAAELPKALQQAAELRDPEGHHPGNFDTAKRANALLLCLCQRASETIRIQHAELETLRMGYKAARLEIESLQSQLHHFKPLRGNGRQPIATEKQKQEPQT
jgi:hypothetical protein